MQTTAGRIVGESSFDDRRLSKRFERLVDSLVEHPEASVPEACGSWASVQAAYRFFSNAAVDPAAVIDSLAEATLARCVGLDQVLVVQDTSSLDYTRHRATVDLGVLEHPARRGLFVHTSLAVTPGGVPVGLLGQKIWARPPAEPDPTDHRRHRLPLEAKESAKWVRDWNATATALQAQGSAPVLVADQEADIYEVYATVQAVDSAFVIRARHDRAQVDQAARMITAAEQTPVRVKTTVAVARRDGQRGRTAHLEVRYLPVTIAAPAPVQSALAQWWAEHPQDEHLTPTERPPLPLTVILVSEPQPPAGCDPLRWVLLTNLSVQTPTEALTCVGYYRLRWLVERFHFVLKRGCRIEDLQLRAADRLMRAIAVYSGVAWRLLWLTYQARRVPDAPCTDVVDDLAWQALWAVQHPTVPLPSELPSLRTFVRQLARLGGFLARKHDGEPGITTLWRGLRRLDDIVWTYATLKQHPELLQQDLTCV